MRKFLIKILIIFTIAIVIIFTRIFFNFNNFTVKSIPYLPLNNVSNSQSFRAKVDHLVTSTNFRKCTFLIAGSSMSLNNISGNVIHNRTKECVYNISSSNFIPKQFNQLLKIIDINSIKYILIAFNNCDFGKAEFDIDFKETDDYINGNKLHRLWNCIKKFNINKFSHDCDFRDKFSNNNNTYASVNFDEYGSVLLEHNGFTIDKKRWNYYWDTTGFNIFYNDISDLNHICNQHKIFLFLVYLPYRPNLLPTKISIQNQSVAEMLQSKFGKSLIDLHNFKIPLNQYCDGVHMFKDGAECITNLIIDSLNRK